MIIGTVEDHRNREGGAIIYPVYSRRSGGLSVGVNLFPDTKVCSFDCPYCEVFPFKTDIRFKLETMKAALALAVVDAKKRDIPVRDICFSGSGEPSISPHFTGAMKAAAALRDELVPEAKLVVITNGTGLLNREMFDFLQQAAAPKTAGGLDLQIWLKLDAATEAWYHIMDRSAVPHGTLILRIKEFAACAPCTIQTMLCRIRGALPPAEETAAWVTLVTELAARTPSNGTLSAGSPDSAAGQNAAVDKKSTGPQVVQIYGKARPAPEDPLAEAAPAAVLEARAVQLRAALKERGLTLPVAVYE